MRSSSSFRALKPFSVKLCKILGRRRRKLCGKKKFYPRKNLSFLSSFPFSLSAMRLEKLSEANEGDFFSCIKHDRTDWGRRESHAKGQFPLVFQCSFRKKEKGLRKERKKKKGNLGEKVEQRQMFVEKKLLSFFSPPFFYFCGLIFARKCFYFSVTKLIS